MEKNKALISLIHISNCNLGFIPSSPAEFNQFSTIITRKTGHTISVSSLKRLWGYVSYVNFPSRTTLNILAKFNDFKDWNTFVNEISYDKDDASSSYMDNSLVNANTLNIGDILKLTWGNNKGCLLEYISYLRFRILEPINIKLQPGDTCTLHSVCVGMPLFISNIQRDDMMIPAYIGAKKGGIQSIEIIPMPTITEDNDRDRDSDSENEMEPSQTDN